MSGWRRIWPLVLGLAVFAASVALAMYAGSVNAAPLAPQQSATAVWLPLIGVAAILVLSTLLAGRISQGHARSSNLQLNTATHYPGDGHHRRHRPVPGPATHQPASALIDPPRFMAAFRRHWKNCRNQSSFLALAQLAIDDFHRLGDEFGQDRYEKLLDEAGQSLASLAEGQGGLLTRHPDRPQAGFLALFPNTTPDDAYRIVQDMCQSIEDLGIDLPGDRRGVMTASAGLCISIPSQKLTARELFDSADRACDRARGLGRGRVEIRTAGKF